MSKILLKGVRPFVNGKLSTSAQDMLLEDGCWSTGSTAGAQVVDGQGALALPALFALGVDFQEPVRDDVYNLEDGFAAMRRGGFAGALYESAANPLDDMPKLKSMQQACVPTGLDVRFLGAFSTGFEHKGLAEMLELSEGGVAGFGDGGHVGGSLRFMRLAMEYGRMTGKRFFVHPMEKSLRQVGLVHEGIYSDTLGMKGIPRQAETIAVYQLLELASWLQVPLHLRQITCAESLELIARARGRGQDVTCDVGLYHLLFDDSHLFALDSNLNVQPPLRNAADREALWQGLLDGTVQAISCNHLPVLPQDKEVNFEDALPGAISLEVALAALWQPALLRLQGDPARLLQWLGSAPASLAGATSPALALGGQVALVLFDPSCSWTIGGRDFAGKPENSPLLGQTLHGRVRGSYVGGQWLTV
jgi:dihydroorotase